jgi:DNA-binding NarL/FixJ family response regulator
LPWRNDAPLPGLASSVHESAHTEDLHILKPIQVVAAHSNDVICRRLVRILSWEFGVLAAVFTGEDLVQAAMNLFPDVIICDVALSELSGIEAKHRLKDSGRNIPFVFVCADEDIREHLIEGLESFVHRQDVATQLNLAVRSAAAGKAYFSRRYSNFRRGS